MLSSDVTNNNNNNMFKQDDHFSYKKLLSIWVLYKNKRIKR